MKLNEKLKFEREKQGYTLNELSELTGLHRITLHDYETGKIKNIPSDKILLLSKIYKKDPNYFLLDNDKNIKSHNENIHNIEDINAIMLVNKQLLESLSIDNEEIKKFLKKYYKFIIKNIK
ncbi:helix-turn-helix domain-containing protein [Leptotrichia sp. oral taxon 879]|jgi:transcriptional regulator, XRE family|uniref:helix-turn-helix domain-containing protein n=1 Tax=Leptotrichia sp. oral taxon 879 TaxID=1227267 RepID=UPI0003FF6492|nr:helix-turn-helix transcriptional regulator [Leptotrichia sp. oral taxon 879]